MNIDIGIGAPNYLAHITIGFGKYCLWLNIVAKNWNKVTYQRDFRGCPMGCLSVFTFAFTK